MTTAKDMLAEEYLRLLGNLGDQLRVDVDIAFSLSKGTVRVLNIYEPDYTPRKRNPWKLVVPNLSIEGADQSVPALLRALADLLEGAKEAQK